MTTCKNCAHEFEGKYCSECGQKASTKRFSTRILFSQLIDKLLPVDRGILFTSWHLVTRPGKMLRDYLDGKRMNYTKPLQFLLFMVALSLIFFHRAEENFMKGFQAGVGDGNGAKWGQQLGALISENMTLLVVGMVPFTAWMARLFFRKSDVNYAEHTVVNSYLVAGSTLLGIPVMIVLDLLNMESLGEGAMSLYFLIYIGYFIWGYIGLFRERSPWNTGFKTLMAVSIGYLLYVVALMIVAVAGIVIYFLIFGKPK